MIPVIRQGHYRDSRDKVTRVLVRIGEEFVEFNDGSREKYETFHKYYEMVDAHED